MKVLLVNDVKSLGKKGDVVEVKNGFGLNFLLPEGLAVLATPAAIKGKEQLMKKFALEESAQAEADLKAKEALTDKNITLTVQATDGKLFGSVSKKEIREAVAGLGVNITEEIIALDKPIKEVGEHSVVLTFGKQKVTLGVIVNAA
jgi:large subunit ribosomal protein L9